MCMSLTIFFKKIEAVGLILQLSLKLLYSSMLEKLHCISDKIPLTLPENVMISLTVVALYIDV